MGKRRTHPYYLSNEEAAREERRQAEMVRDLTGISPEDSDKKNRISIVESKRTTRVGETNNFIVDFSLEEKLVTVYGKEVQAECPLKLAFDKDDITRMVDLLKKACDLF